MKIISIGDIHGKPVWENIDFESYDKVIFVGDYTDATGAVPQTDEQIESNLLKIIELKKKNIDKVILLIGNHDIQYIHGYKGYSRYRPTMEESLGKIFKENINLFKIAHQEKNFLWTHAGVTAQWYKYACEVLPGEMSVADRINTIYFKRDIDSEIIWWCGPYRRGYDPISGPVWADAREFIARATSIDDIVYKDGSAIEGVHQIVGHSRVAMFLSAVKDTTTSITFIDVLDEIAKFHILEIEQ